MTAKRRRWHRHRYLLTPEPVESNSVEAQFTEFQAADVAPSTTGFRTDFWAESQRQGEVQATPKAKSAEAAQY